MNAVPAAGLRDPVHDAQRSFRVALDALSRPARVLPLGPAIAALPLGAAAAQLLLALADEETPVWWQQPQQTLAQWLRFHTGARSVDDPAAARFAVVTDAATMPPLDAFDPGSAAAPERSCTLLVEVPALQGGPVLHARGPGIRERQPLAVSGLPAGFWDRWHANHAAFPQGVDLFFTCGAQLAGLPRTTRIGRLEGL